MIIKREEDKNKGQRRRLREHRILVVRKECRAASLAYGFLRGSNYFDIERKVHENPDKNRVKDLVKKYCLDHYWSNSADWKSTTMTYNTFQDEYIKKCLENLEKWYTIEPVSDKDLDYKSS